MKGKEIKDACAGMRERGMEVNSELSGLELNWNEKKGKNDCESCWLHFRGQVRRVPSLHTRRPTYLCIHTHMLDVNLTGHKHMLIITHSPT